MSQTGVQLDGMGSLRRTHACGEVTSDLVGSELVLAGWVHRRRDHGGVIFVDLRDRDGIVQVVFKPEIAAEAHEHAGSIRSEYVILVRGVIEPRSEDTVNPKMKTGEVELNVHELRLLNTATPPPFPKAGLPTTTTGWRRSAQPTRRWITKARSKNCSRTRYAPPTWWF